jgi:UDP-glucose 4-epimerase
MPILITGVEYIGSNTLIELSKDNYEFTYMTIPQTPQKKHLIVNLQKH